MVAAEVTSRFSVRRDGSPHTRASGCSFFFLILFYFYYYCHHFFSLSAQKLFITKITLAVLRVPPAGSELCGFGSGKAAGAAGSLRGACAGLRGGGPAAPLRRETGLLLLVLLVLLVLLGGGGGPVGFARNLPGLGQSSAERDVHLRAALPPVRREPRAAGPGPSSLSCPLASRRQSPVSLLDL